MNVSKCFNGKTHDFNIRTSSEHIPKHVEVIADSGYQGIAKLHANSTVPYKRGFHFANARSSSIVPLIRNLANRFM